MKGVFENVWCVTNNNTIYNGMLSSKGGHWKPMIEDGSDEKISITNYHDSGLSICETSFMVMKQMKSTK